MEAPHLSKKDPSKIIFAYDFKDFRYITNSYRAKMTKNKVAKHEIMNFFQRMYQKVNGFNDLKQISSSFIKTAAISVTLVLIGIFLIIYGQFSIQNKWLFYSGIGIVLLGLVHAKCGRSKCIKYKNDVIQKTRERILEYLRTQGAAFEKKNIKWKLPNTNFDWIELEVDNNSTTELDLESGKVNTQGPDQKHRDTDHTEHSMIQPDDSHFNYAS